MPRTHHRTSCNTDQWADLKTLLEKDSHQTKFSIQGIPTSTWGKLTQHDTDIFVSGVWITRQSRPATSTNSSWQLKCGSLDCPQLLQLNARLSPSGNLTWCEDYHCADTLSSQQRAAGKGKDWNLKKGKKKSPLKNSTGRWFCCRIVSSYFVMCWELKP